MNHDDTENAKKPRPPFGKAAICGLVYLAATIAFVLLRLGKDISPAGIGRLTMCSLIAIVATALIAKDGKRPWSWIKIALVTLAVYVCAIIMISTTGYH